ncbi:MAG: carboxypeptidase-like regulatory domain-containing protein [Bacteroidetes bacterium]|nr:carboxypeptidase-like regulatory domain-containing protein [Bacteroidota bacterium]
MHLLVANRWLLVSLLIIQSISFSIAQIRGKILDAKNGKPLEGVEVFINQSAIAASSDKEGAFQLAEEIPQGFIDLILFKKGYQLFQSSIRIEPGRIYNLNLSMERIDKKNKEQLSLQQLNDIKTSAFRSLSASQFKVINKDFANNGRKQSGPLQVELPLIIENYFLGYRLTIYANPLTWTASFNTPIRFEYLSANGLKEVKLRELNRKKSYNGTLRHFLKALSMNRLGEEGYTVTTKEGLYLKRDSLLEPSSIKGYFRLRAAKELIIKFKNGNATDESVIRLPNLIDFSNSGRLLNTNSIKIEGSMANGDLGMSLPIEYKELENVDDEIVNALGSIYESVYLHTDKPYYYPGEPIWFKAYMNYYNQELRNSISKLLYVELINPTKAIVLRKQLALDSGFASNDFILPDTLKPGTYFLRSYTNSMRNFGDENLFVKELPILPKVDKVDYAIARKSASVNSKLIKISTDKELYKTRDRVQLSVQTYDSTGLPIDANMSISITDATQVVDVPLRDSIEQLFPIQRRKLTQVNQISYPVETGITLAGHFYNNKGKIEKTKFDIIQWSKNIPQLSETNDQGFFWQTGFKFYDSAYFLLKSDKASKTAYGTFKLEQSPAATHYLTSQYSLPALFVGSVQRIVSAFEVPKGDSLLNVVQIKGKKIDEEKGAENVKSTYGSSDFMLADKDLNLNYPNLLYALVGKVPGMTVNIPEEKVFFTRASGMTVNNPGGPMVMINDVPVSPGSSPDGGPGNAGSVLAMIDPRTVKSIGFTKRINVLYGTQGANGVISVYTKQDISSFNAPANFQRVQVAGFNRERQLLFPDYTTSTETSIPDYRSTIYWNPHFITDENGRATVSFFSADLPGIYHVVIEGITSENKPIHADYYFEVESR